MAEATSSKELEAARRAFPTVFKASLLAEARTTGAMRTTEVEDNLAGAALVSALRPEKEGTETAAAATDAMEAEVR